MVYLWSGFPPGEQIETTERVPSRMRIEDQSLDVFCLVKQNMSDANLSQHPLLVMPHALLPETESFLQKVNTARAITPWLSPEREEEIRNLAAEISEDFPHMGRTVTWYRSLLDENPRLEPYPRIRFLSSAPKSGDRWCQYTLGERVRRPKPHALQVVFHRGG